MPQHETGLNWLPSGAQRTKSKMNLIDLMLISLRSLNENKLRSLLTILGVVIGISAVMTMVSIGQGVGELVRTQFKNLGANVIVVTPASGRNQGVRSGVVMTLTK